MLSEETQIDLPFQPPLGSSNSKVMPTFAYISKYSSDFLPIATNRLKQTKVDPSATASHSSLTLSEHPLLLFPHKQLPPIKGVVGLLSNPLWDRAGVKERHEDQWAQKVAGRQAGRPLFFNSSRLF